MEPMLPPLILASASPRRQELLRFAGLSFAVQPSQAEEVHNEFLTGCEVAQVNSYRKARSVAKNNPDALVLGADTVVFMGQKLFGKPATLEDAVSMLLELQGKTHYVATGVCLLHLRSHRQRVFCETTAVGFHPLNQEQIRSYLVRMNPLDKAGAYAIQSGGEFIVATVEGSYSNVVGLPLERLRQELASW